MAASPPSISSRLLSERLRSSVTRTSSASWCLVSRSDHGRGEASASWRSDGLALDAQACGEHLGRGGALHLEGAQLVEHDLDLVRDARQPARLAGEDQVLLLLGLEQEQVEQLLLPPQQRRQVLVVHVPTALPSSAPSSAVAARCGFSSSCHRHRRRGRSSRNARVRPRGGKDFCRRRCDGVPQPAEKNERETSPRPATDRPRTERLADGTSTLW